MQHADDLVVMKVDGHLDIEADKLAQVAARVRLLSAEDGPDFEHALEVRRDGHLLVQLRRLRKARCAPEIVRCEDARPSLGFARDDLGRVDLGEALL